MKNDGSSRDALKRVAIFFGDKHNPNLNASLEVKMEPHVKV